MNPKAVIWDMDGTLIDSEPLHADALAAALNVVGLAPVDGLHEKVIGLSADAVYDWLCNHHGLTLPFADWIVIKYDRYLDRLGELRPMPGALEFWAETSSIGLAQAVASNSDRIIVDANLKQIGVTRPGLATVSRNDVRAGKPDPEIYLRAAWLLGVDPSEAVALEDSLTGARAAVAAGMRTFMIGGSPHSVPDGIIHAQTPLDVMQEIQKA